ncbi:MAG: motility protein [Bacteroidetes bacterium]|nr:motility protein [Bacteroidota bacterium]
MITMIRNKILLAAIIALFGALLLSSCNNNVVFSQYHTFKENEWHVSEKAVFNVEIKDTMTLNNINLMIRHADAYPYNNLFLFVTTKYPDGKVLTDTMEIVLANQKGEWQGSGAGDIFDFKIPVKKNVRFPLGGKYEFIFEQGMRVDPLPLIMDFGLEIEKSKN